MEPITHEQYIDATLNIDTYHKFYNASVNQFINLLTTLDVDENHGAYAESISETFHDALTQWIEIRDQYESQEENDHIQNESLTSVFM